MLAGGEVDPEGDPTAAGVIAELRHGIDVLDRESRELAAAAAASGPLESGEMSPEMRRQLRQLGYLE